MDGNETVDRSDADPPERTDQSAGTDADSSDDDAEPAANVDGSEAETTGPGTTSDGAAVDGDEPGSGGDGQEAATSGGHGQEAATSGGDERGASASGGDSPTPGVPDPEPQENDVPADVQKYARFKKMDGAQYDRVNEFLRDRTYITAREWAIARLCSDFRTETGVEMTKIGENLPELVPFMTDTYTPQAVNQARSSFEDKVRTAGATFLYGAMCDFFTAEELDDVMYEATEVAKFLLEVEGVDLSVEDELEAEERISSVMREVREASEELRAEDVTGDEE